MLAPEPETRTLSVRDRVSSAEALAETPFATVTVGLSSYRHGLAWFAANVLSSVALPVTRWLTPVKPASGKHSLGSTIKGQMLDGFATNSFDAEGKMTNKLLTPTACSLHCARVVHKRCAARLAIFADFAIDRC